MIRPFTCLCMMLAAGSGMYLYQEKHRSQVLDEQIVKVLNAADANRERVRVLRAEYQLLQDPTRMEDLANQHLALVKIDPKQFVNWASVEKNFPVVAAPAVPAGPVDEPPAVGPAAEPPSLPAASAPMASTAPAPSSGVVARSEPPRVPLNPIAMAARAPTPPPLTAAIMPARALAQSQPAAAPGPPLPPAAPVALASAALPPHVSAAGAHAEQAIGGRETTATMRETAPVATASGHGGAGPAPQRVALTARHQGYGGTQGSDDGAGRFSRAAPAEPTAASVSALGMARMLPTPTFVAPPTFQPFGNGG